MLKVAVDFSVYEGGRKKPEYTLDTDLNGEVSLLDFLNFTKATLIVTADVVLKEEQATGFDKKPVVTVDGQVGKPVIGVNPLGSIEFSARAQMTELILETYEAILHRSPVLTGRYKSSNFVFLNGQQVASDMASLKSWLARAEFKSSDLIRFVNVQPYARKLERLGVTYGNAKFSSRSIRYSKRKDRKSGQTTVRAYQPNGTYFLTARAIKNKYKRNAGIKFTFISGGQLGISGSFKQSRSGKPGRPYLYPTIIIAVSEGGSY